jgi:hypothetical protein
MSEISIASLKVGTAWTELEVASEPDVVLTFRGYAPVLEVRVVQSGLIKHLYISAKSLSVELENLRRQNKGAFKGLRFRLRKESADQTAPYVLESIK